MGKSTYKMLACLMVLLLCCSTLVFAGYGINGDHDSSLPDINGDVKGYMPPNPEAYPELYDKNSGKSDRMQVQKRTLAPKAEMAASIDRMPGQGNIEKVLAIPVYFSDIQFDADNDKAHFELILDEMREYYETNSQYSPGVKGISIDATVVEAVYSEKTMDYYGKDGSGIDDFNTDISELAREAVQKLEARGFDFRPFDSDSDDIIDHLFIIHAGQGQEEINNSNLIWSHRYEIEGGEEVGGVRAKNYVMVPETGLLGTFAHEFGHDIGLPDLYDTDYYENGISAGVGDWDLMGSGSWNRIGSAAPGSCPANLSAWSRLYLGWTNPETVSEDLLDFIEIMNTDGISGTIKFWTDGNVSGDEYYLAEYRRKIGYDEALPGEGLLIWHVDNQWINSKIMRNAINAYDARLGVELEQADGKRDMWYMRNSGDDGDPFPGSSNNINFTAVPYALNYSNIDDNVFSHVAVENISCSGDKALAVYYVESGSQDWPAKQILPNNNRIAGTRPTFSWERVPQAEYFLLQISTSSNFEEDVKEYILDRLNDGLVYYGEHYDFTLPESDGLQPDTTYYWRVIGYNEGNSLNPNYWSPMSFTTIEEGQNTWESLKSIPVPIYGMCAVGLEGKVYLLGGYGREDYTNEVFAYNPDTDRWTSRGDMKESRSNFGAVAYDGKIYSFGGNTDAGITNTTEVYDPDTDTWTYKASMPRAVHSFGSAVLDGKIYVVGGFTDSDYSEEMYIYDIATDMWTSIHYEIDELPAQRNYLGVAAANGKIYAIGGYDSRIPGQPYEESLNTVEEYDPETGIWTTKSEMPIRNYSFGIASMNDKIYIIGGVESYEGAEDIIGAVYEYDPAADTWKNIVSMDSARYNLAAAVADGVIYAVGGSRGADTGGTQFLDAVEAYTPDIPAPEAPDVSFSFSGQNACKLMGITADMEYSLDGGVSYISAVSKDQQLSASQISSITAANDIRIRVKAQGETPAGKVKRIDILAGPSAPNVTRNNTSNTISGINSTMEFSTNRTNWTIYSGASSLPDLSGNITIYVRIAAADRTLPGSYATLTFTETIIDGGGGSSGGGGGSSGGGGGSSGGVSNPPPVNAPASDSAPAVTAGLSVTDESVKAQINDTAKREVIVSIPSDATEQSIAADLSLLSKLAEKSKNLVISNDAVNISFPPGAVSSEQISRAGDNSVLKVSIEKLNSRQAGEKVSLPQNEGNSGLFMVGGSIFQFNAEIASSNKNTAITSFTSPVTISISLEDIDIGGIDTDKLGVYYYNEATKSWEYVGGTFDAATNSISFDTMHFSYYTVMECKRTFNDITTHWARSYIEKMAAKQIAKGHTGNNFLPESSISRAEFTAVLVRALQLKDSQDSKSAFTDIKAGKWYETEANKAYSAGLIRKEDGVNFRPDVAITREEMAVMIVRALQYKGLGLGFNEEQINSKLAAYDDSAEITPNAREAFVIAIEKGIIKGRTVSTVAPKGTATRAEAMVMIYRLLGIKG